MLSYSIIDGHLIFERMKLVPLSRKRMLYLLIRINYVTQSQLAQLLLFLPQ
ncbi:hypothetical protein DDD_1631 [Nonlabens dokdonensis DSW-6]|uniref:Uncharacterized protein n=1 Tax=Nonlabens dokdonensis (strain DSM 17205 / KCTC 12402 / DSW-6) TaxID=592029 RepID=L7WCY1_NONDD|nr:hypothetical protein DDD_1631 [Nonlabens dokdonensis DSW-6]